MLLLSALISQTQAQYYFEYSPLTKEAYTKITSLRFAEGRVLIDSLKRAEPNNLCVYHIENYIDFFSIFINEEQAEFEALELNKNARLDMIRKGPKDSPYLLFCEAEIHLQWALARLKFEEYFTAFTEVSKAYKQLEKNMEQFPDFKGNLKSLGILHAMVGTVPDNYKWGLKLIGRLDGTIAQGKSELEEVLAYSLHHDFIFAQETQVIYAFLLLHLDNKSDLAWQTIQQADLDPSYNPLACFAMANIAMRSGRSEEALEILRYKPSGEAYLPFYYLDLLHGYALLYKLDPSADVYIETYLNNYRGVNLIKDAYQKLAWYYLVHGNTIAYQNNMRLCKIRGNTLVDSDKSAMKEALKEDIPNTTLLSARLLFDGGYYQEAKEMLMATPVDTYEQTRDRLEYAYRLGRINHALLDIPEAIHHYNYSIAFGINAPYFYACNAALQCGTIYESLHELKEAKRYFDLCLSMNPEDYKTSLHQKAKAGLNRLKDEDKQIK
jgi:tetratricopeptide (TPR) repeat protein